MTIKNPHLIDNANCILKRYDKGIDTFNKVGTGVIETIIMTNMGNKDSIPDYKLTDVACTLKARDWKGMDNYGTSGVVECQK